MPCTRSSTGATRKVPDASSPSMGITPSVSIVTSWAVSTVPSASSSKTGISRGDMSRTFSLISPPGYQSAGLTLRLLWIIAKREDTREWRPNGFQTKSIIQGYARNSRINSSSWNMTTVRPAPNNPDVHIPRRWWSPWRSSQQSIIFQIDAIFLISCFPADMVQSTKYISYLKKGAAVGRWNLLVLRIIMIQWKQDNR